MTLNANAPSTIQTYALFGLLDHLRSFDLQYVVLVKIVPGIIKYFFGGSFVRFHTEGFRGVAKILQVEDFRCMIAHRRYPLYLSSLRSYINPLIFIPIS